MVEPFQAPASTAPVSVMLRKVASPEASLTDIVPVAAGTAIVKLPDASSDDNVVVPPNVSALKIKRLMATLYS
jgi:hypothetical protein